MFTRQFDNTYFFTFEENVTTLILLSSVYVKSNKNYGEPDSNLGKEDDVSVPSNHELVSCLAVGARWITVNCNLQVL